MGKIFIIAEAGVNHNGDMKLAENMVEVAATAGADAVKFQTFSADKLVVRNSPKAAYQLNNTDKEESQHAMLKKLELSKRQHETLQKCCKEHSIMFLSTPFDYGSIELLESYDIQIYKIPSGEITNYPYLKKVGSLHKPVILSTGMSDLSEVQDAVSVLRCNGSASIVLLHCNTQYPTPIEDVNLRAMITMGEQLGLPVGYSDHTRGIEVSIAAAALGAVVIEKHFTISRDLEGPDHKASLEPAELKAMVAAIRNVETALGNGIKQVTPSEKDNRIVARKSIVASKRIAAGEIFSEENLTVKRPGTGITPMHWDQVLGLRAKREFMADELIEV